MPGEYGKAPLIALGTTLLVWAACAGAQLKFPERPIRLVASTTAGSQPDMIARTIGQKIHEHWGAPVVVDNRPGGGGSLAAAPVAKATPDGHTLLYALPNFATSAVLQQGLPYDPLKDFTAVAHIGISTNILVCVPSLGAKSVAELVAAAKARPGKLIHVSSATGSASHLSGARFTFITGIKAVHVAYKGGPDAIVELLGGRGHFHIGTMGVALPFVREGKLVALAVTSPERAPVLPDVPALGEYLAEFKRPDTSHGILTPAGTPRAVVEQLNKEIVRILNLPDVRERLNAISYVIAPSSPQEYDTLLRAQIASLSTLTRDIGLRPR
jgi:tripartite-type tricarboxylate transporter receptor subunit TctC